MKRYLSKIDVTFFFNKVKIPADAKVSQNFDKKQLQLKIIVVQIGFDLIFISQVLVENFMSGSLLKTVNICRNAVF